MASIRNIIIEDINLEIANIMEDADLKARHDALELECNDWRVGHNVVCNNGIWVEELVYMNEELANLRDYMEWRGVA